MLKQIKLRNELLKKQKRLKLLTEKKSEFKKRAAELDKALGETETEEDTNAVEEQINALESEIAEVSENLEEEISTIKTDIENIGSQIEEINTAAGVDDGEADNENNRNKGGKRNMPQIFSRQEVRELIRTGEYYKNKEVREFYDKFKNIRAIGGEGLTIPQLVINRIMDIVGDYATLYPLVEKITCNGTARILIDTDTEPATWLEQKGALPQGDVGTITSVDFDGYKIGKAVLIDEYIMQDSIINIDTYVVKKLARAIALGLDKSILKGEGSTSKQPDGVIPKLPTKNKITIKDPANVVALAKPLALIDTGEDSTGEIVAVMHRQTYYDKVLDILAINLNGGMVGAIPAFDKPNINGLKVVFNNFMDKDKILYGDFSKYTLVERESMTIENDKSVKFLDDQIAYKGRGRFDGKPIKPSAFVLATISFTTAEATTTTT